MQAGDRVVIRLEGDYHFGEDGIIVSSFTEWHTPITDGWKVKIERSGEVKTYYGKDLVLIDKSHMQAGDKVVITDKYNAKIFGLYFVGKEGVLVRKETWRSYDCDTGYERTMWLVRLRNQPLELWFDQRDLSLIQLQDRFWIDEFSGGISAENIGMDKCGKVYKWEGSNPTSSWSYSEELARLTKGINSQPDLRLRDFFQEEEEAKKNNKSKKTFMTNIIEFAKNMVLSADEKLLRKQGLKDEYGNYTEYAWLIVKNNLLKAAEADLVVIAKAKEAEDQKNK
jgi:hypothetical protein